jgi:hypothetical protein
MPGINQFAQLIPWLFLVFVPLLYVQTSRNPKITIGSLFTSIFVIILLSFDEQRQSYAFSTFMNSWISLCGGFALPVLIFCLFNSLVPERMFSCQVSAFFADCGHLLHNLKESLSGKSPAVATIRTAREQWQGRRKQLQVWASMINHKRMHGNDQIKTGELIDSIEHLAVRLETCEYAHGKDVFEPLRQSFFLLYDSCIESCQLIASAMVDLKPVPELPASAALAHDVKLQCNEMQGVVSDDNDSSVYVQNVLSITTHMALLAAELNDCRNKVNGLDWKRWNQNYFQ